MIHSRHYITGLLAAGFLALAACSSQQEPAQQAATSVENALAAVREDAARYVPDQLQSVEAAVAHLKDQLGKSDYRSVIAGAPGVTAAIGKLKEEAASSRADYEAEWGIIEPDVSKMVDAIQSRVDVLSKSRRLPKEVTKEAFEAARTDLEQLKSTIDSARSTMTDGNALDAVTIVKGAQAKGRELLAQLGMSGG